MLEWESQIRVFLWVNVVLEEVIGSSTSEPQQVYCNLYPDLMSVMARFWMLRTASCGVKRKLSGAVWVGMGNLQSLVD